MPRSKLSIYLDELEVTRVKISIAEIMRICDGDIPNSLVPPHKLAIQQWGPNRKFSFAKVYNSVGWDVLGKDVNNDPATSFITFVKQKSPFNSKEIKTSIMEFYEKIKVDPNCRLKSWEYCYNHFRENRHTKDDAAIDLMALHLGFYLASWGMYRGSSFLMQKDYRVHIPAIKVMLEERYEQLWDIKPCQALALIDAIIECGNRVKQSYADQVNCKKPSDTLLTKILLGVYACVPAYDRFFMKGLKKFGIVSNYGRESLTKIVSYCCSSMTAFEESRTELLALGADYPPMKLVDMFIFSVGKKLQ